MQPKTFRASRPREALFYPSTTVFGFYTRILNPNEFLMDGFCSTWEPNFSFGSKLLPFPKIWLLLEIINNNAPYPSVINDDVLFKRKVYTESRKDHSFLRYFVSSLVMF